MSSTIYGCCPDAAIPTGRTIAYSNYLQILVNVFESTPMTHPEWKKQVQALLPLYLLQFSYGMSSAFPAILTAQLQESCDSNEEITIDTTEAAWIVSIDSLTTPFVSIIAGSLQHAIGPKKVLAIACIPYISSWVLTSFKIELLGIYASRVLIGISNGVVSTSIYAEEIASKELRGSLCSLQAVLRGTGSLLVFGLGPFLRWHKISYLGPLPSFVALLCTLLLSPESPVYLIRKKKQEKAKAVLKSLHGSAEGQRVYQSNLECNAELKISRSLRKKERAFINMMRRPEVWKPLLIVLALSFFQQFSGMTVLRAYVIKLFDAIFGDMTSSGDSDNQAINNLTTSGLNETTDPEICDSLSTYAYIAAFVLSVIRLVATVTLSSLLYKVRRRILHFVSTTLTTLFLLLFGLACMRLEKVVPENNVLAWCAVVIACGIIFSGQLGVQSMPNLLSGELFPTDVRSHMKGLTRSVTCLLIAGILHLFPLLQKSELGVSGAFYLFAAVTFVSVPFGHFFLPETKDVGIEEIFRMFNPNIGRINS